MRFLTFMTMITALAFKSQAGVPLQLKSSSHQQNLLELFTSGGCSSCPPADRWLSSLRHAPGLWTKFVPIEFHVHYWDHLGWKDPFAKVEYTARQKNYASLWKKDEIYTPAVVLDGKEWLAWRKGNNEELAKLGSTVGTLQVDQKDKRKFLVKFKPSLKSDNEEYFINGALLGNGLTSQVSRGENSGINLHHDFIALSYTRTQLLYQNSNYEAAVTLPTENTTTKPESYSAVFWISGSDQRPIQAVGEDLAE